MHNQVTDFGARLDTAAGTVFVAAGMAKLLPVLAPPAWLWEWTGIRLTGSIVCAATGAAALQELHIVWSRYR